MLCPEVWNFDPPPFSVSSELCDSEEKIFHSIKYEYFNHYVGLTVPNTIQLPNDLINAFLDDSQYYRINKISPAEFLKKSFIEFFINKGNLTAVSLSEFSQQNSLVITPCGKLILSLTKSTFQELGVECALIKNHKSSVKKYVLTLDLTSYYNESKKNFEKLQKKFSACSNLYFDVIIAWEPENTNVCPSSIAYYFSKKGYFLKTCDVLHKQELKYNVTVPVYDDESDAFEIIEWLGAFSLECSMSDNSHISSLKCPEKNEQLGQVLQLSVTGLVTHNRLKKIISEISKYVTAKSPLMWISLNIQSFHDSLMSIKNKNLIFSDGEKNCTIVFRCNCPSLIYTFQEKQL